MPQDLLMEVSKGLLTKLELELEAQMKGHQSSSSFH